jgi:hypothetical protein
MEFQSKASGTLNVAADDVAAFRPFLQDLIDWHCFAAGKVAQLSFGRIKGIGFMGDAADSNQRLTCLRTKKQG